MLKDLFNLIYYQPIWVLCILVIWGIYVWGRLGDFVSAKCWIRINHMVVMFSVIIIIWQTLLFRSSSDGKVYIIPFLNLLTSKKDEGILRSMIMNSFLFVPLGLTVPYILPKKWKHNVLIAILFGLILSIAIEFLQYYFCLGRAETDDVICNTLGCAIGTIAFWLNRTSEGNSNSN